MCSAGNNGAIDPLGYRSRRRFASFAFHSANEIRKVIAFFAHFHIFRPQLSHDGTGKTKTEDEDEEDDETSRRSSSRTPPPTVSAAARRDGVRVAVASPPLARDEDGKTSSVHINGDHVTHVRVDASVLATPPPVASPALSRRSSSGRNAAEMDAPGSDEQNVKAEADEEDRDQGELIVTTASQVAGANQGDAGQDA